MSLHQATFFPLLQEHPWGEDILFSHKRCSSLSHEAFWFFFRFQSLLFGRKFAPTLPLGTTEHIKKTKTSLLPSSLSRTVLVFLFFLMPFVWQKSRSRARDRYDPSGRKVDKPRGWLNDPHIDILVLHVFFAQILAFFKGLHHV